jgi:hypothetical protein
MLHFCQIIFGSEINDDSQKNNIFNLYLQIHFNNSFHLFFASEYFLRARSQQKLFLLI